MKYFSLISLLLMILPEVFSQQEARLLRFPAIFGDTVVFSYAGDLYTVKSTGGIARKLTSDDGYEMFARFSPDGKHIAFTGQYDGNTEVYLMPAGGGVPVRLTYTATLGRDDISDRMGPNNMVLTWKNNDQVIFRSRKDSYNDFKGKLYAVSKAGGLPEELPLPAGGFCSYSPDQSKIAYNRVMREFRTWKYYRGGMADDIWIYDFATKETVNITNNEAQDIFPMWSGNEIFFLSDRDRTMNLFVYNVNSKEIKKLTNYTEYDIKFPSLGTGSIIYENGGYLYLFDIATKKPVKISVTISDDISNGRNRIKDASRSIHSWSVSPDGKRFVFGARGDVFSVPAKSGITRNLTSSSGAHDRNVAWSPDGRFISYISDMGGENEIYIIASDGSSPAKKVTSGSDTYKYYPQWSPDSKKLLWSDKLQRLQYIDIESLKVTLVDKTSDGEFHDFTWSPDSKWIAYTKPVKSEMPRIWIYNTEEGTANPVTDGWYASNSPAFSSDGKYIFFISGRDFNPVYSWTEWNHAYTDMEKIYFVTTTKDLKNPLAKENDEVKTGEGEAKSEPGAQEEKKEKVEVKIDFDGIAGRITVLPVEAGSYWGLQAVEGCVYYAGNKMNGAAKLRVFDLKTKKETELGEYGDFAITYDRKKMAISANGKYAVIDLPKSKISIEDYTNLSDMTVAVNLKEEWNQIFFEAWRQMRDFFYDPEMHQVDWKSKREKYAPLVPYINDRNDLNYIIGEMIGELSAGHAYVGGGDRNAPERIKLGLLGARISKDASGYYRIDKILQGENWTGKARSPLTMVGVDARAGDLILAVDGMPVNRLGNFYEAMVGKAGKMVELTLSTEPDFRNARKVLVEPTDNESELYYYEWVQNNIRKVNEATNGQVGYIHIPDMGVDGLNEFVKHYYPQLKKRALIIDDRGNGGGNVSPMIIERLNRELTLMSIARNGSPSTKPNGMVYGPKIMLIDNYSASDGDLFPYQFKKLGMGKLVGVRTWGGVVGIRGTLPFIDGAFLNKPEFAHYDAEGKKFVIEGRGVEPDVWIDNDPAREYQGVDEQLNKAIELITEELKNWPEEWPQPPAYPDKSK